VLQDQWKRVYELELEVGVPDGYNIVYPGTGNTIVETAADHITGDAPIVKVPLLKETEQSRTQSETLEKWDQAALYQFQQHSESDPVRGVITDLLWAGMVVSQGPLFDPDAWGPDPATRATSMTPTERKQADEDYEAEKKANWPFVWRLIDPRYVFADPGTHGRRYVIIKYERNVGEIMESWPGLGGKLKRPNSNDYYRDTDLATFYECWTEKRKVYIAAGDLLLHAGHNYGKPPFQIKASGLGRKSGLPHERYRSILFSSGGKNGMLAQEIRAACQFDAVMRNAAWTMMVTPIGSKFKKLEPGKTQPMAPKDIELTKAVTEIKPEVVAALRTEQEWIDSKIQDQTYPKVASGRGVPGSGYLNNSLAALAKMKFTPMIKAAQDVLGMFFADLHACVENEVKEPVPVFGPTLHGMQDIALKPEVIAGNRYVRVILHPKLPVDRANEVQIGHMLKADGAIDDDTYIEDFAGYEQPEEMRVRIMRDRILQNPLIQGIMALGAAKEMGMLDTVEEYAAAAGLDPKLIVSQVVQALLGAAAPGAPPSGAAGPGGGVPPGAPNAPAGLNGTGGGTPDTTMFPTAQTQPQPGSLAVPSQVAAARGAGVPRPGMR
jgi:hypothetical protein